MVQPIRERAVIQPGGILHIQRSDLPAGATVEVTVTIAEPAQREKALPPLTSLIGSCKGTYGSPEEADAYLQQERDLWE